VGTLNAAAKCEKPVSNPTTTRQRASNWPVSCTVRKGGTTPSQPWAMRRARASSSGLPQSSRGVRPWARKRWPSAIQWASGQSFSGRLAQGISPAMRAGACQLGIWLPGRMPKSGALAGKG
jgi:hypothetical protein